MIKIAICDDEEAIISQIENRILDVCKKEGVLADIDVFYGGKSLFCSIQSGGRYDLLYLDIQMDDEDGITAARNIRCIDTNMLLVFVSSYDEYMRELFRFDVFDFVRKPIVNDYFDELFLDAVKRIGNANYYFCFRYNHEDFKYPIKDILYFESVGRKVVIHLQSGEKRHFNGKLADVVQNLSESKASFLRTHQSYLVNYHHIKSRTKTEVTLTNDEKLPISEDRRKAFSSDFVKLLDSRC